MEEYLFTDLVAGDRHSHTFTVNVEEKQTSVKDISTEQTTLETTAEDTTIYIIEIEKAVTTTEFNGETPERETTTDEQSEAQTIKSLPLEQNNPEQVCNLFAK